MKICSIKYLLICQKCFAEHSVPILWCQLLGRWVRRLKSLETANIKELEDLFQQTNVIVKKEEKKQERDEVEKEKEEKK